MVGKFGRQTIFKTMLFSFSHAVFFFTLFSKFSKLFHSNNNNNKPCLCYKQITMSLEIFYYHYLYYSLYVQGDGADLSPEDRRRRDRRIPKNKEKEKMTSTVPKNIAVWPTFYRRSKLRNRVTTGVARDKEREAEIPSIIFLYTPTNMNPPPVPVPVPVPDPDPDPAPTATATWRKKKAAPAAAAATVTGRKKGASNWNRKEIRSMLLLLRKYLPTGPEQWMKVAQIHGDNFDFRMPKSIRRKWLDIARAKPPTGATERNWENLTAREIKKAMEMKEDLGKLPSDDNIKFELEILKSLSAYREEQREKDTKKEQREKEEKEEKERLEERRAKREERQAEREERQDMIQLEMIKALQAIQQNFQTQNFQTPSKKRRID